MFDRERVIADGGERLPGLDVLGAHATTDDRGSPGLVDHLPDRAGVVRHQLIIAEPIVCPGGQDRRVGLNVLDEEQGIGSKCEGSREAFRRRRPFEDLDA